MQIANDRAARVRQRERKREKRDERREKKDRGRVGGKKFPAIIAGVTRIGER